MYSEAKAKEKELEKEIHHHQFPVESIQNEEVQKIDKNEKESEDHPKAANSMETNQKDKMASEDRAFASTSNSTINKKSTAWKRLNKIEPTISDGKCIFFQIIFSLF